MAENPAGPAGTALHLSDFLALKVALKEQNLARLNTLLTESTDDDDGIPEGLDERTAEYLVNLTGKVKSNLLTLNEHHNSDMENLLDALADEQTKLGLVQAKLGELEHPIKSSYNQRSERFYSPLNSTRMNRKTWIENDAVLSQLFLQWIREFLVVSVVNLKKGST